MATLTLFQKKKAASPREGNERSELRLPIHGFTVEFKRGKIFKWIVRGEVRDLSIHGVHFVTSKRFARGNRVNLTLCFPEEFPGPKRLMLDAKVVRVIRPEGAREWRVACCLRHPDDATRETIRQYLWWYETLS